MRQLFILLVSFPMVIFGVPDRNALLHAILYHPEQIRETIHGININTPFYVTFSDGRSSTPSESPGGPKKNEIAATPLSHATQMKKVESVRTLLELGAQPDIANTRDSGSQESALSYALKRALRSKTPEPYLRILELFCTHYPQLANNKIMCDKDIWDSPLRFAVEAEYKQKAQQIALVKLLVLFTQQSEVQKIFKSINKGKGEASDSKDDEIVKILEGYVSPEVRKQEGVSPEGFELIGHLKTSSPDSPETPEYLLRRVGSTPRLPQSASGLSSDKETPIISPVEFVACVPEDLSGELDVEKYSQQMKELIGVLNLLQAIESNQQEAIIELVRRYRGPLDRLPIFIAGKEDNQLPPLFFAIGRDRVTAVKALLDTYRISPNQQFAGYTALSYAFTRPRRVRQQLFYHLLCHEADPKVCVAQGTDSLIEQAAKNGDYILVGMIERVLKNKKCLDDGVSDRILESMKGKAAPGVADHLQEETPCDYFEVADFLKFLCEQLSNVREEQERICTERFEVTSTGPTSDVVGTAAHRTLISRSVNAAPSRILRPPEDTHLSVPLNKSSQGLLRSQSGRI